MISFDILYGNIIELFLFAESNDEYKKYNKKFKAPSVEEMLQDMHSFNCIDIFTNCTTRFGTGIYKFTYHISDICDISMQYLEESLKSIPVNSKYEYYFGIYSFRKDIDGEQYPVRKVSIRIPSDKFVDFRYMLLQTKTEEGDNYYI